MSLGLGGIFVVPMLYIDAKSSGQNDEQNNLSSYGRKENLKDGDRREEGDKQAIPQRGGLKMGKP